VVLEGKNFAISNNNDTFCEEVFQIVAVLRQVKVYIANIIAQAAVLPASIQKM
jgi:hypothetical protein